MTWCRRRSRVGGILVQVKASVSPRTKGNHYVSASQIGLLR